ncbi:Uric acid transporter UacT [Acinetobacter junii]|nr:Uric acid transporter UacT [Acinetobacter junii]
MHNDKMHSEACASVSAEHQYLGMNKNIIYGLQHVLTMYGGIIAPPIIIGAAAGLEASEIGLLVAAALFVGGIATMLQTLGFKHFGAKLPIVQGGIFCWCCNNFGNCHHRWRISFSIWRSHRCVIDWFITRTILFKNYSFFPTCGDWLCDYDDWYFFIARCDSLDDGGGIQKLKIGEIQQILV